MTASRTDFANWLQSARQGIAYTFPASGLTVVHRKISLFDLAARGELPDGYAQDFAGLVEKQVNSRLQQDTATFQFADNARLLTLAEELLIAHWLEPEASAAEKQEAVRYLTAEEKMDWLSQLMTGGPAGELFPDAPGTASPIQAVAMAPAPDRQDVLVPAQ